MSSRGLISLLGLSLVSCSGPTSPLSFNPQSSSSFSSEQSSFPYSSPNTPYYPTNLPSFHASTNQQQQHHQDYAVTVDPMEDFDPNEFAHDNDDDGGIDLIAIGPPSSEVLTHDLLSLDLGYNVLNSKLLRQNLGLRLSPNPSSQGIIQYIQFKLTGRLKLAKDKQWHQMKKFKPSGKDLSNRVQEG